jgi:methylmalonyl-CoA/ethylmalonyl-CoA epimerase
VRIRERVLEAAEAAGIDALVAQVARGAVDPHTAADRLLTMIQSASLLPAEPRALPAPGPVSPSPGSDRVPGSAPVTEPVQGFHIRIDHIGVAVRNLDDAGRFYREVLGLPVGDPELLLDDGVAAAFVAFGDTRLELLEAATIDGPIARFIERRGEGIHHVALAVPDLGRALENARDAGYTLVDEKPRRGARGTRIAFLHPKSTHGMLIELVEHRTG